VKNALIAIALSALLLAGCGGGGSSSSAKAVGSGGSSTGARGHAAEVSTGFPTSNGLFLVDENDLTLYTFSRDKRGSGRTACFGRCAKVWLPLTTEAPPKKFPIGRLHAKWLGTIERAKGVEQVTYAGYPLYRYYKDEMRTARGDGRKSFGGRWYMVSPTGERSTGG
jgi:predicted lipoprotein with Yx(FWY)xxD motif